MKLFLGVDGGQSSTTALIGDERGRVLGRGAGGPCNHATAAEGRAKLQRAVAESLAAACREAQLDCAAARFTAACFGMSGGPEDKEAILAALIPADRLIVTHDAAVALFGATETGQGIVTIAGTGSIAFGRNDAGQAARAGGWGYVFGDEGGGFDIVRQAVRAALRMEEGWGPPTSLRQALLDATGQASANSVLHLFYTADWPRSRAAALASLVDSAAAEGDPVALRILESAAQELALLAAAVRTQLWLPGKPVDVAYIGGVFASQRLLEHYRMLVEFEAGNRCTAPLRGPAEGALLEALRSTGIQTRLL
jgi:N-acetylglucosamine kinase-like BadF-type ATPase